MSNVGSKVTKAQSRRISRRKAGCYHDGLNRKWARVDKYARYRNRKGKPLGKGVLGHKSGKNRSG